MALCWGAGHGGGMGVGILSGPPPVGSQGPAIALHACFRACSWGDLISPLCRPPPPPPGAIPFWTRAGRGRAASCCLDLALLLVQAFLLDGLPSPSLAGPWSCHYPSTGFPLITGPGALSAFLAAATHRPVLPGALPPGAGGLEGGVRWICLSLGCLLDSDGSGCMSVPREVTCPL